MLRLWIVVLTLALITGSAYGANNVLSRLGLGLTSRFGQRLFGKIADRVGQRVEKVQDRILNRIDGVTGMVAERVSDRLDNVAVSVVDKVGSEIDGLTNNLASGLTGGLGGGLMSGVADGLTNKLTSGVANRLTGGMLPGLFGGGGDKNTNNAQAQKNPNRPQVGVANQNQNVAQNVAPPPKQSENMFSGLMSGLGGLFG